MGKHFFPPVCSCTVSALYADMVLSHLWHTLRHFSPQYSYLTLLWLFLSKSCFLPRNCCSLDGFHTRSSSSSSSISEILKLVHVQNHRDQNLFYLSARPLPDYIIAWGQCIQVDTHQITLTLDFWVISVFLWKDTREEERGRLIL